NTEKAVIKQTQHAAEGDKVPNFAKALQSMNEADGKTSEIRADIMDAINRQRQKVDGEQNMTVRNMIAAQTENKDRTEIDLSGIRADKTLQERLFGATPTTNTSTASSVASTSGSSPSASASAVVSLPVQPNIQSSAWSQVMNSRVVWMAKEGIQQAEMKMNPANLGPVEVKLHVQNEQASVTFLAQHSTTRDALEQALPKLRESFAENGMQLTHAEVGQQQQQQQRDEQPQQMQNSQNFTQANRQSDDIMSEADETAGSVTQDSGLSLYV
ncbi:flagellar hook-length control protein FliK, partial [Methylophaga sp. UBA5088]